jgi:hypothetical protein
MSMGVYVFRSGDPAGTRIPLPGMDAKLSPDGAYLAFTYLVEPEDDRRIGLMNLTTLKTSLVDSACHNCYGPVWSPDGKRLAYNAMQDMTNIYLIDLSGKTVRTININSIDSTVGVGSSANFLLIGNEEKLVCDCEVSTDITNMEGGPPPHLLAYDLHTKKLTGLQPKGIVCFDQVLKGDTIFCTGYLANISDWHSKTAKTSPAEPDNRISRFTRDFLCFSGSHRFCLSPINTFYPC